MNFRQWRTERRLRRDPAAALHRDLAEIDKALAEHADEPFTHCAGCGKALTVVAHPTDPAFCSIDCGYAYNGLQRNR